MAGGGGRFPLESAIAAGRLPFERKLAYYPHSEGADRSCNADEVVKS